MNLSVPTPCSQSWTDMAPTETGRYCSACEKGVIDFTTFSEADLIEYFKKRPKKVCGRFRAGQLGTSLGAPSPTHSSSRIWPAVIASGLALISGPEAKSAEGIIPMVQLASTLKPQPATHFLTDSISAQVRDQNGTPLPTASVFIQHTAVSAVTDENGRFSIAIPESLRGQPVVLIISSVGFNTETIRISPGQTGAIITLSSADCTLADEVLVVGGAFYKRNFWQKIKDAVIFWR